MAHSIGSSSDWQSWASKWMPELQNQNGVAPNLKSSTSSSSADDGLVLFSSKAEKLQHITDTYFSNGAIHSSKIRDLSFSLYQQGLISGDEFRHLTGESLPQAGLITDSMKFLSGFIESESVDGDTEGAVELNKALNALHRVDEKPTAESLQQERESANYVKEYRDLLVETDSDPELIEEFDQLVKVFDALLDVRSQAPSGVQGSYAALQKQYFDR